MYRYLIIIERGGGSQNLSAYVPDLPCPVAPPLAPLATNCLPICAMRLRRTFRA